MSARQNESAVSPVVAVMLMLVVTIIIAAVVSGFAGSLVGTNSKTPHAVIEGKYSNTTHVLQMYHAGGDELPTQKLFVLFREKDEQTGGFAGSMARSYTNKSNICSASGKCWLNTKGLVSDYPLWLPGETVYYTGMDGTGLSMADKTPVGGSFTLEIDSIDGKVISKTDVKVDP